MKLSEEFKTSSKMLTIKGFAEEGELLGKIAEKKLEFFVLVFNENEADEETVQYFDSVFMTKSKAEAAMLVATCRALREGDEYLFYTLEGANSRNKKYSKSAVSKKASSIFGTQVDFSAEEFKVPAEATDQQLIEFAQYLGFQPFVLQKVTLEV